MDVNISRTRLIQFTHPMQTFHTFHTPHSR